MKAHSVICLASDNYVDVHSFCMCINSSFFLLLYPMPLYSCIMYCGGCSLTCIFAHEKSGIIPTAILFALYSMSFQGEEGLLGLKIFSFSIVFE